jgi:integrase/recombinase XerC
METGDDKGSAGYETLLEVAAGTFIRSLVAADYSSRTIRASTSDLRQLVTFLAVRGVDRVWAITRADISAYVETLADPEAPGRKPYTRSTVARKLSVARSFLHFCQDNGLLPLDPVAGVASARLPRRLPQVLTAEQMSSLLEAMAGE